METFQMEFCGSGYFNTVFTSVHWHAYSIYSLLKNFHEFNFHCLSNRPRFFPGEISQSTVDVFHYELGSCYWHSWNEFSSLVGHTVCGLAPNFSLVIMRNGQLLFLTLCCYILRSEIRFFFFIGNRSFWWLLRYTLKWSRGVRSALCWMPATSFIPFLASLLNAGFSSMNFSPTC